MRARHLFLWRMERSPAPLTKVTAAARPPDLVKSVSSRFCPQIVLRIMLYLFTDSIFRLSELMAPFKKRKSKYALETVAPPSELLLRPLSPITPPLPSEPSVSLLHPLLSSCSLYLGAEEERQNGAVPPYSPLPSLPASRCNTPLQFEVRVHLVRGLTSNIQMTGLIACALNPITIFALCAILKVLLLCFNHCM